MDLKPKLSLSRWPLLEPLVRHYRQSAPPSSVTLGQHHLFMVLLIAFIDDAFLGWVDRPSFQPEGAEALDLAVMKAITMISANPLDPEIAARATDAAPIIATISCVSSRNGWGARRGNIRNSNAWNVPCIFLKPGFQLRLRRQK